VSIDRFHVVETVMHIETDLAASRLRGGRCGYLVVGEALRPIDSTYPSPTLSLSVGREGVWSVSLPKSRMDVT
jgi:hypothetical protein